MIIEAEWLVLLATVAFTAGFVDTLAGGGGLITIPAFLFAGFTPAQALATNKCQAFAGTLTAALRLITSGHIKIRSLWPYALLAFVMALTGAWGLREVSDADWLDRVVPILLLAAATYFGLVRMPETVVEKAPTFGMLALVGVALIGFYDGFFGPGTGSLFALLMISVLGLGLREATIHAKLFNAMTNMAAFLVFATSDLVVWLAVMVMIPAQILGALAGTRVILGRGIVLIRPLIVVMCGLMAIKLASEAWLP
ncbi:MAG: TSUP family transporter [Gammaproteobacteria bacterium]